MLLEWLYGFTLFALLLSLFKSREKTYRSLRVALEKLLAILPSFSLMLIVVSLSLYLISDEIIVRYLGGDRLLQSGLLGSLLGSITIMPGFVAFPLSALLVEKGVSYTAIAAFTTTLMLVGLMTLPVEAEYFGWKLSLTRNLVSFFICLVIALIMGFFYGELVL